MFIPNLVLKQLYTFSSLQNTDNGVMLSIKNRLSDASVIAFTGLKLAGKDIPLSAISIDLGGDNILKASDISASSPVDFPLKKGIDIHAAIDALPIGKHKIEISFTAKPFGKLTVKVEGSIEMKRKNVIKIPRDKEDDYSETAIKARQNFISEISDTPLKHIPHYSFDAHALTGNCESFTGVAQIPLGFAGPLQVNGEHADGQYIIPLATTEGTLVASYNRGMKLLNLCGGVKCSVVDDAMQRAPVFEFDDARGARDFTHWVEANLPKIRAQAEGTTSVGKLKYIDYYLASKFAYLRFNFLTGDAAGQNMVGRATFAACSWILDHYKEEPIRHFYLESNLATDKKASQVNIMHTRGKRVTAECIIKKEILEEVMRVTPQQLVHHHQIANVGAILSGANNNGLHSANGITAMFMATGQDVANVAESSAGIFHGELTAEGDLYVSITIPSLIVATYGGGTNLATQQECLSILKCVGKGKVRKFAEIIAGVVLAGEMSLASAISSSDWVSSHEKYGRNR